MVSKWCTDGLWVGASNIGDVIRATNSCNLSHNIASFADNSVSSQPCCFPAECFGRAREINKSMGRAVELNARGEEGRGEVVVLGTWVAFKRIAF